MTVRSPTKDDVMKAICCPRGCQAVHNKSMCHTCRHRHETQAESVMRLYAAALSNGELTPSEKP